ncbi:MAG: hypothetical protein ACRCTE_13545, partial [Cellulosilyticaceae bacterium]
KDVSLIVYGSNNLEDMTAKSAYEEAVNSTEHILYQFQKGNKYVLSWEEGDRMYYRTVVVGEGSSNTFEIDYPSEDEKQYDAVVERLYSSFKTPNIDSVH